MLAAFFHSPAYNPEECKKRIARIGAKLVFVESANTTTGETVPL